MLATDVGQLLQVVVIRKEMAEPFHRCVVPFFRAIAALTIVACYLVELGF